MRIQHNILAMNAYRNYNTNTNALSKNLEKLSSGYKINRAGDDAAGLAISEKMRAQITGLNAASKNVKDGISLVKTAEGAMQEIHDMLNRMEYLATQSANGTYDDDVDRLNLQKEVTALKSEIDRIAESANFNGIQLLNGKQEGTAAQDASTVTIKGSVYEGKDRILQSDIGKGEEPWQVNGKKNVYDVYSPTATKASFEMDFSKLKIAYAHTASKVASATYLGSKVGDINLTIGGETLTIKASKIGSAVKVTVTATGTVTASIDAQKLASAALTSIGSGGAASKATFKLNGMTWKVEKNDDNNGLKFTQITNPSKASQCQANFSVKIEFGTNGVASASQGQISLRGSLLDGTHALKVGAVDGGSRGAETVFEMKDTDIVDGAILKLGDNEYTLKVGANSTVTSGSKVIDLSMLDPDNINLNDALSHISTQVGSVTFTAKNAQGSEITCNFKIGVSNNASSPTGITILRTDTISSAGQVVFDKREKLAEFFRVTTKDSTKNLAAVEASGGLDLQIGDTNDPYNKLTVVIKDMRTKAMGIADVNIGTQDGAAAAIQTIKDAINYVSSSRGDLGAIQNRLEHTSNNLSVMAENIQDAESSIRDTDVAEEMMAYTKNNILVQSAQAMLAQANAVPQGVLQLLG